MFRSSKGLAALLAVGVAVIAIALWVTSRTPSAGAADTDQPVLPGLDHSVNSITKVRLAKGDGTHTTLEKKATEWVVAERGFPADSSRVRKLLLNLAELKVVERKTSDPASYPEIGVEDVSSPKAGGTLIDLTEPGKTLSLIVGKPSGTNSSFVRVSGVKQSLLATPQLAPETDPRRWLDSSVFTLPESRVKEVEVKPASGPAYTVTRADAKQTDFTIPDLPKGRKLTSASAPDSIASALASLTLNDVRKDDAQAESGDSDKGSAAKGKPKDGAVKDEPVHATFHTFDGLTVQVTGHQDGDHRLIAVSAESSAKETADEAKQLNDRLAGWEMEIPGYQYDAIFQPLDGLLQKPEKAAKAKEHGHATKKSAP